MMAAGSFQATRTTGTVSVCEIACSIGADVLHFSGAVLQVDAQGIEALARHDLGGEPVGHGKPAQRHAFPGTPHLLDLVRSHVPLSLMRRPCNALFSIKLKPSRNIKGSRLRASRLFRRHPASPAKSSVGPRSRTDRARSRRR